MRRDQFCSIRGSALLTSAVAAGVLSIIVAGLLTYLSNEYTLNNRSNVWTRALYLAEAGTELGFAEMNNQYIQGGIGFQSSRGWSAGATSGSYVKTVRGFTGANGQVVGDVTVTVSGVGSVSPVVQSVATCPAPPRGTSVTRTVRVTLAAVSQFPVALMSKNKMDLNGNNIYVDSYDSSDPSKSTGNLYDSAKRQANGNVASNGALINSLRIGNADIYGVTYTGVGGTVALGPGGSIGPTFVTSDRATTTAAGEANGWIEHDFNVDVPDVILPSGATYWSSPPGTPGGNITKDITLGSGDYRVSSVSLTSNSKKDELKITGTVRLYVTGSVDLSGMSQITIASGGSLQIYVGGSVSVSGSGGVINSAGSPLKAQFYGLPTSTSWNLTGNGRWNGTIYAPEATVSFKGGGSAGDASGAVVANIITLTGNAKFHYDESLRASDTGAGYAVASWQELKYVSGSWVP